MASNRQKLNLAANTLAKYYGIPELKDLLSSSALNQVIGGGPTNNNGTNNLLETLLANFMNASSGALTTSKLIKKLNQIAEANSIEEDMLNKSIQIHYVDEQDQMIKGTSSDIKDSNNLTIYRSSINEMLEYVGSENRINKTPLNPSKESPTLSVILANSNRIGLAHRDTTPITVFLNGMPNVELSRAVPHLNIEFAFPRPPVDEGKSGRIQTLSLSKFLLGAEKIDDPSSPGGIIANAGQISSPTSNNSPEADSYATAGMELFCSPQTLVNADATDDPELHSAEILDKFRPLMSLQSLDINVVPSKGMMSFKTADMKFVLHDRSRLSDIAEFVRADLYGKTEITIEYGWNHPEGESVVGSSNPYGDLINGMKNKEKYQVINSSFTFDDGGQVIVTLKLAMKGAIDFDTELISADSESLNNAIKDIEELQKIVGDYRERIFSNTARARSKEIRGIQVLDAAQDALNQVSTGKKLREEMSKFRREMKKSSNPNAKALVAALEALFEDGKVQNLGTKILESVNNKMKKLQPKGTDPFLILPQGDRASSAKGSRNLKRATRRDARLEKQYSEKVSKSVKGVNTGGFVSLAKLLLNFVAEPLTRTNKFDDIQFIFYPFNSYAGAANNINIGNFAVNLGYFTEEYARYRLDHISKSGNMNLSNFLDFLSDVILDDPAARSYGLFDKQGSFYKNVFNEDGTQRTTEIATNVPDFQKRMEEKLKTYGIPDGSFKMPQIDFYIESLPETSGEEDGEDSTSNSGRTILRIHVFDRQATSYDTLQALLASTRDAEIEAITSARGKARTSEEIKNNTGVEENNIRNAAAILSAASEQGLIKQNKSTNNDLPKTYSITGSPRQLKEFMMKTMPYIIYGAAGTTIKSANLSSIQDSKLSTINLLRSFEKSELEPNGENPGGLPMRIIPTELSLTCLGCPLLNFAQQFFVDFQTGTTADAIYAVSGITHAFAPGSFETNIKMAPLDGWGRYMSLVQRLNQASEILKEAGENNPFDIPNE